MPKGPFNLFDDNARTLPDGAPGILHGERRAIELASGGRNTLIVDKQGNPNVMVVVPRFNYEDLGLPTLNLGTGTPTAFLTNGVPRSEILIGKYLASSMGTGTAVIGGVPPRTSTNFDSAKSLCTQKGPNWHLMSAHEWAAIALWCLANGIMPRGNTSYGRSHEKLWETARRSDNGIPGGSGGSGHSHTGHGPTTWNHDHTEWGICDLVGNVWEWLDQLKLKEGRVISTLDNDPLLTEGNWTAHAAYLDSTSTTGGSPVLNSQVVNRMGTLGDNQNGGYSASGSWRIMAKDASYTPMELMRRLLIESASASDNVTGTLYMRNYGERSALRGGGWTSGINGVLGTLHLNSYRATAGSDIGFRPASFT